MKRSAIIMLAGLNLFLLGLIISATYEPPSAFAQARARAGDYVCVSAKPANQSWDVVYVLDKNNHALLAYIPQGNGRNVTYQIGGIRNIKQDFNPSAP